MIINPTLKGLTHSLFIVIRYRGCFKREFPKHCTHWQREMQKFDQRNYEMALIPLTRTYHFEYWPRFGLEGQYCLTRCSQNDYDVKTHLVIQRVTDHYRMSVLPCKLFPEQLRCEDAQLFSGQLIIIVQISLLPHRLFPEQLQIINYVE